MCSFLFLCKFGLCKFGLCKFGFCVNLGCVNLGLLKYMSKNDFFNCGLGHISFVDALGQIPFGGDLGVL